MKETESEMRESAIERKCGKRNNESERKLMRENGSWWKRIEEREWKKLIESWKRENGCGRSWWKRMEEKESFWERMNEKKWDERENMTREKWYKR